MDELEGSGINSLMAEVGNPNKTNYRTDTKTKRVQDTRTRLMINLRDYTVTLPEYMLSFGTLIDCKEKCDDILEDLEEELNRDEEIKASKQPIETTPGAHSKVSKKSTKMLVVNCLPRLMLNKIQNPHQLGEKRKCKYNICNTYNMSGYNFHIHHLSSKQFLS